MQISDKMIAPAETKLRTMSLLRDVYSGGREPHLPANICTTDPAAACDRITVGDFVGGDWTDDIAPGACHASRFPETVPAPERREKVWLAQRRPIDDGCFMAADNRKLIAGCNRFARRSPDIDAHG